MIPEKPKHLLASYALGGLRDSEKDELFRAALDDQELFDLLVEEENLRVALEQPQNRALLMDAVRAAPVPTGIRRVATWFRRPVYLGLSAAITIAVTILIWVRLPTNRLEIALNPNQQPAISMLSVESTETGRIPQPNSSPLFRLPVSTRMAARLGLNKRGEIPEYRLGEPIRIGFSVEAGGNCILVDRQSDGSEVRLFPNKFQSSSLVAAGQMILVPPAGQGNMIVTGQPGLHRLRLVVVPSDTTLDISSPASWEEKATVVQQQYRVLSPGRP